MKNWADYFDNNGLLVQKGGDGGDTPSHEGLAWLAQSLGADFPSPLHFLDFLGEITVARQLIRNPISYNNPTDTSRDQYRSVAIACHFQGAFGTRFILYKNLPRNKLGWPVYPNGDIFSPQDWQLFNQGNFFTKFVSDLFCLGGILVTTFWTTRTPGVASKFLGEYYWLFIAMNPPNEAGVQGSFRGPLYTSDDLGAIMTLIYGKGTLLNRFTTWIYTKFRIGGPQAALDNYFAGDDAPPINELYKMVIPHVFN
jgi:hypothetical protein